MVTNGYIYIYGHHLFLCIFMWYNMLLKLPGHGWFKLRSLQLDIARGAPPFRRPPPGRRGSPRWAPRGRPRPGPGASGRRWPRRAPWRRSWRCLERGPSGAWESGMVWDGLGWSGMVWDGERYIYYVYIYIYICNYMYIYICIYIYMYIYIHINLWCTGW